MIYASSRRVGAALWLLTALVGLSRVLAGVHHFTDICGAMLIGAAAAWLIRCRNLK